MEHNVDKVITKLQETIKLPHYDNAINIIVNRIYDKGFKLCTHSDYFVSSANRPIINLGLNKKDTRSILWDLCHEFGHLLDPLPKVIETTSDIFGRRIYKYKSFEIKRELQAWETADNILKEFHELSKDESDYQKYKDECLASYAFSFNPIVQNKMNEIINQLKLVRDYDCVIGKLIHLVYTHPNNCTIELSSTNESSTYQIVSKGPNIISHQILLNIDKEPKTILWELLREYGHLCNGTLNEIDQTEQSSKRTKIMLVWKFVNTEFFKYELLGRKDKIEFRRFAIACLAEHGISEIEYSNYIQYLRLSKK